MDLFCIVSLLTVISFTGKRMKKQFGIDIFPSFYEQKNLFNVSCEGSGCPFFIPEADENRSTRRKGLGVRLRSTNLSPRPEPRTRSRFVEIRKARLITTTLT